MKKLLHKMFSVKGFTLQELIVTVSIIIAIIVIAVPRIMHMQERFRAQGMANLLRSVYIAQLSKYQDTGQLAASIAFFDLADYIDIPTYVDPNDDWFPIQTRCGCLPWDCSGGSYCSVNPGSVTEVPPCDGTPSNLGMMAAVTRDDSLGNYDYTLYITSDGSVRCLDSALSCTGICVDLGFQPFP